MHGVHRKPSALSAHWHRFMIFAMVGAGVFLLGTALQYGLIQYGHVSSDCSYTIQTAFSVLLSFACNWAITWRDLRPPLASSLVKWCAQKVLINIPNVALYAWLEHRGLSWLAANVIATAVFTLVNYIGGHYWSFRRFRVSVLGAAIAAAIIAVPVAIAMVPQLRPLVYVAWLSPVAELGLLLAGTQYYRRRFRENEERFSRLIVQITTRGHEAARVNEIIRQVRDYSLDMPHWIWVVTEEGDESQYAADMIHRVPASFECTAKRKGRALEYALGVKRAAGLDRDDVKTCFLDDDVTPSRAYLETAFRADYDVSEGVVTPRTGYGFRPLGHFLASHADDIRTQNCLVYCSVFQGIIGRPLHVHGEGLVATGRAESLIGWDRDCMAEDLSFGQTACKLGLKWGWFHEYVEGTSAWRLRDYFIQHRRWLWGDIHAIRSRELMGWGAAFRDCAKYLQGILALSCSAVGLWLRFSGRIPSTEGILNFGKLALIAWVAVFFACGWVAASSAHDRRSDDSRMLSGVLAVLMMPVSALLTWAAILIPLIQGDPGDFRLIRKTRTT